MKEILLIIVLISGLIKGQLLFLGIPTYIDFTLISFIVLILYLIINPGQFSLSISKNKIFIILSIIIFYLWMIISLIYTSSNDYSRKKVFLFLTNLIPLIYVSLIRELDYRKFVRYFILIIFILNLFCLSFSLIYIKGFFGSLSSNYYKYISGDYLVLGELTGLLTLILLCYKEKPVFRNKFLDNITICLGICFLFLLSARGPLIFFILSLLLYIIFKRIIIVISNIKVPKIVFLLIPIALVLIIFFYSQITSLLVWSYHRFHILISDLFVTDLSSSTNTRIIHLLKSLNVIFSDIQSFIFGKGIGSYMYEISGIDGRGYPHNIFLEVWFEMGIIGLFLFLAFLTTCFLFKFSKESKTSWIVFLYILLNLLKSNSLVDIRTHIFFFAF